MSINGQALIVGAYEHPTRRAPDKSVAQLHAEVAQGALADAGLSLRDALPYANRAGGIVVGKFGTATVSFEELFV